MQQGETHHKSGAAAAFVERQQERGRSGFSLEALVRETGLKRIAARMQLRRLHHVVQLHPRSDFYLAVDPLHSRVGAPPVEWWIDDFFASRGEAYYIGLLSAAALHGSSPQAIQVTQVVVESFRPSLRIGRRRIQFTVKQDAGRTPVMTPRGARVPVKVSTPEATFFDLIRYEKKLGGMPRVIDVIDGLALSADGMAAALAQDLEVKLMQRAGFLLENIGRQALAKLVGERLTGVRLKPTPIFMSSDRAALEIPANPWSVYGTLGEGSGS